MMKRRVMTLLLLCGSQNCLFTPGGSEPTSNIWFLTPTRVHIPNDISIGSAVFAQLTAECPCTLKRTDNFPSER